LEIHVRLEPFCPKKENSQGKPARVGELKIQLVRRSIAAYSQTQTFSFHCPDGGSMMRRIFGAIAVLLMLMISTAQGLFMIGPTVPIDRLIKNANAYIKEHPDDATGPYTLARIHYLALATRSHEIRESMAWERLSVDGRLDSRRGKEISKSALSEHLKIAVENYQKAIKLDAKNALFHLGLASVSETALNSGLKLGAIPGSAASAGTRDADYVTLWREQAIAEYLRAYELSDREARDTDYRVVYEAGEHYTAMVRQRGPRGSEQETLKTVEATLTRIRNTPSGGTTPIIFSLDAAKPLRDLLDSHRTVKFDLDGTGYAKRYTWVQPDTGILVWDPDNTGHITSGYQLFGSVTFNMFWSDGYRALDALDDDRDGALTGSELIGLAVWFDRNQDGVSQSGEVIPIARTGIASLSARYEGHVGASPFNSKGLVLDKGRVLPTYDWTTAPVPDKPKAVGRGRVS
jgi:hypothetical protein